MPGSGTPWTGSDTRRVVLWYPACRLLDAVRGVRQTVCDVRNPANRVRNPDRRVSNVMRRLGNVDRRTRCTAFGMGNVRHRVVRVAIASCTATLSHYCGARARPRATR